MSTAEHETTAALPPLVEGEKLDRATFHRRYAAMPDETRAELIGGVVYMASPLGQKHGKTGIIAAFWLEYYVSWTPGVEGFDNASVFLDDQGEPQPDLMLRILPECGGRTRDQGNFLANGPELIVEVSDATLRKDLGPKRADYERAGVPEYIVLGVDPPVVRWHVLRDGRLVEVGPDPDGLYRSMVFPGLWLDPAALFRGDSRTLRQTVDLGVGSPEHAAFVARLEAARG